MADVPISTRNPPPDDMHWGISYLREDIQDLRLGIRAIHDRVDRQGETLTQRVDSVNESLIQRTDSVNENLTQRIDSVNENLTQRIDSVNENLAQRIDSVNENLTQRIDSRFAMLLTAMIALNGLTAGSIITFLKFYLP